MKEKFEVKLDPDILPPGATEVLWIHPNGLEFQEVKALVKKKQNMRILYTPGDIESDGSSILPAMS